MGVYSRVLLLSLWGLAISSPVPPSVATSPAAGNLAVPPDPRLPMREGIRNTGLWNPNGDPSTPRLHHHRNLSINHSSPERTFRNIAFLNPTTDIRTQRAPSPVAHRDPLGKMSQPSIDVVSFNHAMVPNYFVMNPPYSKVGIGSESDSDKTGKSQSLQNETGNELDAVKLTNLTLREQHLLWKKEMLEKKVDAVDTKVYQVQNNIVVHSHNTSEKPHAPYKMNTTKSGSKSQINMDNSTISKPLLGEEEKSAEKSLLLTTPKITNRRLLVNNSGLNPNEVSLRPNEIRVSVTLRDKDGRIMIVPAIYTRKASAPPPLTNTEDLALVPVDRNVDIKDIVTTTSLPEVITTEEISTISERIASLLSTTKTSQSPRHLTSSRVPVTPIPGRIFPEVTESLILKNNAESLAASTPPKPTTGNDPISLKVTTPSTTLQLLSTTYVHRESIATPVPAVATEPTGKPLLQTIHQSSITTASSIAKPILHLDQKDSEAILPIEPIFGSSQSNNHKSPSMQEAQGISTAPNPMPSDHQSDSQSADFSGSPSSTSMESILLSSEKAFNESKKLSQSSNTTEVPPFLKDIITKIDERLTELIRETVSRYVENSDNTTTTTAALTGAAKAIPSQTSLIKINLDGLKSETTKTAAKATTRKPSLLRLSLDAALGSTTKSPTKSPTHQKPLIRINLDAEVSSPKQSTTTPASRFGFGRRDSGILGLTQIEPILERITGEISSGAERVRKELSYLAEDSANNLMKNVEEASDRVAEITATSYRGALQTRDAMNRLLGRAVENLGNFVSNAVQDTVKTAFGTAQSVGQFIHDLNVNAMDGILNRGAAVRNLFSNTITDMSEATDRTVQVLSRVMEKNTKTLLEK